MMVSTSRVAAAVAANVKRGGRRVRNRPPRTGSSTKILVSHAARIVSATITNVSHSGMSRSSTNGARISSGQCQR